MRRSASTALPSLAAYLLTLSRGALPEARSVAYASIVVTQLAQLLDSGWAAGNLTRSVALAVAGSAAILGATFVIPPLRSFLDLVIPTPRGWMLIGSGTLVAVLMNRLLAGEARVRPTTS